MRIPRIALLAILAILSSFVLISCTDGGRELTMIADFPVAGMAEPADTLNAAFDLGETSDGNGSFRIDAAEPLTVHLFTVEDVDVEGVPLMCEALVRTEDVDGHVYLSMVAHMDDGLGYPSRTTDSPLYGSNGWTEQDTSYELDIGESPTRVEINLVINGTGTAWVDEVRLMAATG